MRIALFSPWAPDNSGIAVYTREWVMSYVKYLPDASIDVYYPDGKHLESTSGLGEGVQFKALSEFDNFGVRSEYDVFLYQIGNHYGYHSWIVKTFMQYPGIIELHDIDISNYFFEDLIINESQKAYREIMEYCHRYSGLNAALEWEDMKLIPPNRKYPGRFHMIKILADKAKGIIVHSKYALRRTQFVQNNVDIAKIPLLIENTDTDLLKSGCLASRPLTIGVFGHVTPFKRIQQILESLIRYCSTEKDIPNIRLVIVGEIHMDGLDDDIRKLNEMIDVRVTGRATMDEYYDIMNHCDIGLSLRYPTNGESSYTLIEMLCRGIPVIVTDIGTYSEFPDDVVTKISYGENEISELVNSISYLVSNDEERLRIGQKAAEYSKKYFSFEDNVKKYEDYFNGIVNNDDEELSYIDFVVNKLAEVGLTDPNYVKSVGEKLDLIMATDE